MIGELRQGDKRLSDAGEFDAAAAMIYRYARAAQEGSARLNLRLMAKVMRGMAYNGNLVADEFLSYADLLASLRREEIIFLATNHREGKIDEAMKARGETPDPPAWTRTGQELMPLPFPDGHVLEATAQSLIRTGLILGVPAAGGLNLEPSVLLNRLCDMASLEEAVTEENAWPK